MRFFEDPFFWALISMLGLVGAGAQVGSKPGLYIKPFTGPDEKVDLEIAGFYGIVRNPIYLGEVLWFMGWAIMFRSIIGVALVPMWWAGLLFITIIEERSLEQELGQPYLEYKTKLRGRIIPGLPI